MGSSLDSLVKNLNKDQFRNLGKFYTGRRLDLLTRKGVFPYENVDSVAKLAETKLPPIEAFYSKLNDEQISEEYYEHAKTVWNEFYINNLESINNCITNATSYYLQTYLRISEMKV